MKLEKKHVLWMLFFIFLVFLGYIIVSSFFSNNLNFKSFYMYEVTTDTYDENQIEYTINERNEIIYVAKSKDKFVVEKITENNVEPQRIISFALENVDTYSFNKIGRYYYFFYNNDESLIRIDDDSKTMKKYDALPEGLKVINSFDNHLYVFNNNKITKLSDDLEIDDFIEIPNTIKNIKKIDFLSLNEIVISTYNSDIYVYNYSSSDLYQIEHKILNYVVYDNKVYSTFTQGNQLGISIYTNNEETSFLIDSVDYLTMKVKDDYIYLIDKRYIYKVSISRQKRHETLELNEYANAHINLSDVIIVNEKLMYIELAKEEFVQLKNEVSYYLYRYKI